MLKLAVDLSGLHAWCGGDQRAVVDLVELAERKGFDQVCLGDHVIMGEDTSNYPYGKFHAPSDWPWIEPLTILTAIAARTSTIRLNTGVLLSPLRPAVFLAKQVASLDVLSHGRVDLGIGTGWQKAEYEASGVPFDQRAELMYEQVRVCRELWRNAPASFHGKYHSFDRLHSLPRPRQGADLPIWFGVPPTERNIARLAELGHGWMPLGLTLEQTAAGIRRIQAAFTARHRDPATLSVSHILVPEFGPDGVGDIEEAARQFPIWSAIGVNVLRLFPTMFCRSRDQYEFFLDRSIAARGQTT